MSTVQGGQGNIVTNGLVLNLDAANPRSYPQPYNGTTWTDLSGQGSNGTLVNGVAYTGSNGGALTFDGVDDYVTGSLSTIFDWTMCLWYLSTDITSQFVFYPFAGTNTSNGLGFGGTFSSNTNNRWYFFDGSNVLSNALMGVTTNVWYNLVITKSSTTYNMYTNGQLSLNTIGTNLTYTKYTLGRRGDSFAAYAKGNVASAQMYNRALSASEVLQNFNATRARFGV